MAIKTHISIGALNEQECMNLVLGDIDVYLIHYDPQMFTGEHPRIEKHATAVSGSRGLVKLCGVGTGANVEYSTSGTIHAECIDDILSEHENIDMLRLNCEGSEIPILLSADTDLLCRCKRIYVEFHQFVKHLNITEDHVRSCIERLSPFFTAKCKNKHHPVYFFKRRA